MEEDNWIDVIIVLEGINDLQYTLSLEKKYQKENSQSIYDKSFLVSPVNNKLPFYKRSYLFMYLSKLQRAISSYKLAQDPYGYDYIKWRKNRANASEIIDSMPNLASSLSNFENNNESMIDLAKSKNKRIIFLTQPVSWDDYMPIYQKELCWFGWIGSDQYKNTGLYYSFSALKKSLDQYNSLLIETCKKRNVECFDLESILEKDTTTFYDDCHFNESGAVKVAKKILMFFNSNI